MLAVVCSDTKILQTSSLPFKISCRRSSLPATVKACFRTWSAHECLGLPLPLQPCASARETDPGANTQSLKVPVSRTAISPNRSNCCCKRSLLSRVELARSRTVAFGSTANVGSWYSKDLSNAPCLESVEPALGSCSEPNRLQSVH